MDPSDPALETTLDALRAELPEGAIVGGAPAENLDLQSALNEYLPIVVSVILVLGFLLLLIALQAPLIALLGTVVSLLSTGAAFGVAKLIFQDGHGSSLLGFTPQRLPERLGTGVLLRDDLRNCDGLHRCFCCRASRNTTRTPVIHTVLRSTEWRTRDGLSSRRPR